jgi:hypothetical protein
MVSIWAKRLFGVGLLLFLGMAVTALPFGLAYAQSAPDEANADCSTWDALRGKCAKADPNTDDVLDYPNLYAGRLATLEGRVDDVYSPTTFAMEDNYDLIGGDRILMISVMPIGAKTTHTTPTATGDSRAPVPAIEMVQLLQDGFEEGKIIRATGTVRILDRAVLAREFGHIDFGSAPLDKFENEPVLLLGASEYAQFLEQQKVEQQAAVIPPQPTPAPEVRPAPEPQPEVAPPAPQPEPVQPPPAHTEPAPEPAPTTQVEKPETLPKTASPVTLVALSGLMSVLVGIGIRYFR